MNIDPDPALQIGERFPARTTPFAAKTLPSFEVLPDSRTLKGGGAACVAVAQNVLAETQTALLPLMPYLDTLRCVFIGVETSGVTVAI